MHKIFSSKEFIKSAACGKKKINKKQKQKFKIFKLFKIQTVPFAQGTCITMCSFKKKKKKKIMKDNGWKKQGRILVLESTVYCRYIFM